MAYYPDVVAAAKPPQRETLVQRVERLEKQNIELRDRLESQGDDLRMHGGRLDSLERETGTAPFETGPGR